MPISSIVNALTASTSTNATTKSSAGSSGVDGFADSLGQMVNAVQTTDSEANAAIGSMLDGTGDVHDAMIALQRADMTLEFTVQVRNKLVQAYQEVMRMSV
jgi:flagellar hook-basal body complex protein FliE